MQDERDESFVLAAPESESLDALGESPDNSQPEAMPGNIGVTSPLVTSQSPAPGFLKYRPAKRVFGGFATPRDIVGYDEDHP